MRILRIHDVEKKIGIKQGAILRLIDNGEFPKPFKITHITNGWLEHVIDGWIEQRSQSQENAA